MSTNDKDRLVAIAKGVAVAAALAGLVWLGIKLRAFEQDQVAERVVEKLRQGGGR